MGESWLRYRNSWFNTTLASILVLFLFSGLSFWRPTRRRVAMRWKMLTVRDILHQCLIEEFGSDGRYRCVCVCVCVRAFNSRVHYVHSGCMNLKHSKVVECWCHFWSALHTTRYICGMVLETCFRVRQACDRHITVFILCISHNLHRTILFLVISALSSASSSSLHFAIIGN